MAKEMNKLKEKVRNLPTTPGIYLMKDQHDQIIYVGKAKQLRQRVRSYFQKNSSHSNKVLRMIFNIHDLEIIEVDTELDALLLECQLIQQHHPMYNRQMNQFSKYNYVTVSKQGFSISSEPSDKSFGPFRLYKKLPVICEILSELYQMPWINYISRLKLENQFSLMSEISLEIRIQEIAAFFSGKEATYQLRMQQWLDQLLSETQFEQAQVVSQHDLQLQHFFKQVQDVQHFIEKKKKIFSLPLSEAPDRLKYYQLAYGQIVHTAVLNKTDTFTPIEFSARRTPLTSERLDPLLILIAYIKKTSEKE